jgi:hypothetical protein
MDVFELASDNNLKMDEIAMWYITYRGVPSPTMIAAVVSNWLSLLQPVTHNVVCNNKCN